MQTMIQKCRAMKMFLSSAVVLVLLLFVTVHGAEEVTNVDANPSKGNDNSNNLAMLPSYHPKVKRAWNQLQAGWGKRSENEIEDESVDQLQQRLMRMYADQLLANRLVNDDLDYVNANGGDYDVDKRAKWSQLQNGWGKRDWNQLRGK
jgi:hypothetical protein